MLQSIYQRISWLSLDVVSGALAGMLFFARLFRAEIEMEAYLLLGGAVWIIYTLDHLLDAEKIPSGSSADRHGYHLRNKRSLWVAWGLVVIACISGGIWVFGWTMVLYLALGLAVLILGVIALLRKFEKSAAWLKELSNALFYVVGISWLPIYFADSVEFNLPSICLAILYFGLAFLNLLMLSSMDAEDDELKGFNSIASFLPEKKIIRSIRLLALGMIVLCLLAGIFFLSFYRVFALLLLLMIGWHYLSFFGKNREVQQNRQKMELVFSLPWILLFF